MALLILNALSLLRYPAPQAAKNRLEASRNLALSLGDSVCKASLIAMLSASLLVAIPALAFKSILRQANFRGAKLLGASFFDADLTGADLSDADLRGVDFSLANVMRIGLLPARKSYFPVPWSMAQVVVVTMITGKETRLSITGADFTDVPLRDDQREYLCKIADGVNPTTGNPTHETLPCN